MALPGKYIEELTELTALDGSEQVPASKTGATEDYKFTLTRFKNWLLSLTGLSFKENVNFEKTVQATTAILTNLTDGYIPYDTAGGLANSTIFQDTNSVSIGGTTQLSSSSGVVPRIQSKGTTAGIFLQNLTNADTAPTIYFTKNRSTIAGTYTSATQANDFLAFIAGEGADGVANLRRGAYIAMQASSTFSPTNSASYIKFAVTPTGSTSSSEVVRINELGNVGIGTTTPAEKHDVNGISRATNFKKNAFYITKDLAVSANITSATPGNIQMNASTDYEYVISPGITATLNFNDASFQYNSITMVYATGGTALILTSPGVTFYQNGAALVGGAVVGYDGTKANRIRVTVKSSTVFTVDLNTSASGSNITTIGTNGDYSTISAAVTAGKTNLLLISNITEIADITINAHVNINLNNYELNLASYKITINNFKFEIVNGNIKITNPISAAIYYIASNEPIFFNNILFNNTSTANSKSIFAFSSGIQRVMTVLNCTFILPNYSSVFAENTSDNGTTIINCAFVGGGSNCTLNTTGQGLRFLNNCTFRGTFSSSLYTVFQYCNNLLFETTSIYLWLIDINGLNQISGSVKLFRIQGFLTNAVFNNITTNTLAMFADFTIINSTFTNTLQIENRAGSVGRFTNCNFNTLTLGNLQSFIFSTCKITNALTLHKESIVSNCILDSIVISGDNNNVSNNLVGSVAAGTKTITIDATADKTIIIGNRTEAAIVDNGTGTIGAALNTTF